MSPTKQFDDNFWDWYETFGPSWLLTHRMDILNTMFKAYQDTVSVEIDTNVTFAALQSDVAEAMMSFFAEPKPPVKKTKPISDDEIQKFKKKIKNIRIRWEEEQ